MPERIQCEVLINASVPTVWTLITDATHLSQWFSDEVALELWPGGSMQLTWYGHGTYLGRVERVEAPHLWEFSWVRREDVTLVEAATRVTFTVTSQGDATLVRVVEQGFDDLGWPPETIARYRGENEVGWSRELGELARYAATPVDHHM